MAGDAQKRNTNNLGYPSMIDCSTNTNAEKESKK
jgi:hypothetical protein